MENQNTTPVNENIDDYVYDDTELLMMVAEMIAKEQNTHAMYVAKVARGKVADFEYESWRKSRVTQ